MLCWQPTSPCGRSLCSAEKSRRRRFLWYEPPRTFPTQSWPDQTLKKGKKFLVGYVGVMGNADGVNYILDAAAHLLHQLGRKDVQFLLMGTGPEYERLLKRREALGLNGCVDMPGRVSDEFLFAALRTMDLGVSSDPKNSYNDHCTM